MDHVLPPDKEPHLNIRGFADAGYSVMRGDGTRSSFALGQVDLFITSRLTDRLGVLVEPVIQSNRENEMSLEVQRALLQYRHNRYLNFDIGRYHSSIGYYNTAYHHGTWFQTAIDRPAIFAFEYDGGILPIHDVGVSVSGQVPSGKLRLGYVGEIGNGRSHRSVEYSVQNVVDENRGKAVNFALSMHPDWWPGLRLGGSVYRDTLTPLSAAPIRQYVFSGYAVYIKDRIESLNELVWMRHRRLLGPDYATPTAVRGFYSQLSYRIGTVRPYFRYEYLDADRLDPVANALLDGELGYHRATAGIRYDLSEFAALKFQVSRGLRRELPTMDGAAVRLAFTF